MSPIKKRPLLQDISDSEITQSQERLYQMILEIPSNLVFYDVEYLIWFWATQYKTHADILEGVQMAPGRSVAYRT